jgi:LysM repeat protein
MQKWKIVGIALMLCAVTRVSAQQQDNYERRVRNYIEQFKELAIQEQKRSGIPAAITLAQGIHETSAGNSELATEANNHFGIKCKKEWRGMTFAHTDDAVDECFRKYGKAEESYEDHSNYLKGSQRYSALFTLSPTDYAGWAVGLKRCGYATNPQYSRVLIKLIEEYHLQDFTYAALGGDDFNPVKEAQKISDRSIQSNKTQATSVNEAVPPRLQIQKKTNLQVSYNAKQPAVEKEATDEVLEENPSTPVYNKLVKINGLKAYYAKKGTLLLNDAFKHSMRYAHLLELNDLPDAPIEADMYIYLEKKNAKGPRQLHVVKPGESLAQVAQAEGIQLKYLKYYNHIGANEEPVPGALLQLQEYSEDKPETVAKEDAKRIQALSFEGDTAPVVAQGSTRKSSKLIRKQQAANGGILAEATPPPPTLAERREQRIAAARAKKVQEAKDRLERERIKRELAAATNEPSAKETTKEEASEQPPYEAALNEPVTTSNAKPIGSFKAEMHEPAAPKQSPAPLMVAAKKESKKIVSKPAAQPAQDAEKQDAASIGAELERDLAVTDTKKETIPSQESKPSAEVAKSAPKDDLAVVMAAKNTPAEQPGEPPVSRQAAEVAKPETIIKEETPKEEPQPEVVKAIEKKETEPQDEPKVDQAKADLPKEVVGEPEVIKSETPEPVVKVEDTKADTPPTTEDVPEVKKEDILAVQHPVEEAKTPAEPVKEDVVARTDAPKEIPQSEAPVAQATKPVAGPEKQDGPETASSEEPARPATLDDLAVVMEAKRAAETAKAAPDATEPVSPAAAVPPPPKTVDLTAKGDEPTIATADAAAPAMDPAPVAAPAPPPPPPPVEVVKPKEPEEPMDEFARLKARLDKVVYAANDAPPPAAKAEPAPEVKKEAPKKEAPKKEAPKKEPDPKASKKGKLYTVRKGDTAFIIARRNNITMKQLQEWNSLDFQTIKEGQQLRVAK